MPISISGDGTLTGVSVGGLPDGIVDTDMLATSAVTAAKIGSLPAGSILQVVQTVKHDAFSTSASSYTDITGLSASITPSSTSNKVLICFNIGQHDGDAATIINYRITRGGSVISDAIGNISGHTQGTMGATINADRGEGMSMTYLDSPSTTDEITYQIQGFAVSTDTMYINYRQGSTGISAISTIILMEVAG